MKKNSCPYIDPQERCTHKFTKMQKTSKKHPPNCVFNKANRCDLYKLWLKEKRLFTEANNSLKLALELEEERILEDG